MPLRRADRWGRLQGEYVETLELAEFLRDLTDQYGQSLRKLAAAMPYSKSTIGERLTGEVRPEWDFVVALVKACTAHDREAAERLLRLAREKWMAADPSRARRLAGEEPGGADGALPAGDASLIDHLDAALQALRVAHQQQRPGHPPPSSGTTDLRGAPSNGSDGRDDAGTAAVEPSPAGTVPRPGRVYGKVPARTASFVGRADLVASMGRGFATHPVQVVHGPLGVGKTQAAAEYVHARRSSYDLVAWIPADEPALVRSSLAALAPHLGLGPVDAARMDNAVREVLDALAEGSHDESWLLVFDNADRPDRIQHLIPSRGGGDVIITSRDPAWRSMTMDTGSTALGTFTREESVVFLRERLSGGDDDAAHRLAEGLGDLPLALQQAASLLDGSPLKVRDYLRLLADDASRVLAAGDPAPYPIPMTTAWALSAGRLGERSPDALSLLRHCASLGPGPASLAYLRLLNAPVPPEAAALLADPLRLDGAFEELRRTGLSWIDESACTIQVHPLVRALIRDEMPDDAGDIPGMDRPRHARPD